MPADDAEVHDGSGTDGGSSTPQTTLHRHFIDVFEVPLRQITLSSLSRELSEEGLEVVMRSIKNNGWLPLASPVLVVNRESLPNAEFTRECVDTANYLVIDGNHRIAAAKRLFDRNKTLSCRVHYSFGLQSMRIIGHALNATEAHPPRTTFDRLFFYRASMASILEENPSKKEVSAQDMANSYTAAGIKSPCLAQLRVWKKAVCGLSKKAFSAVEMVFRTRDERVSKSDISLNFLNSKGFLALKDGDSAAQALAVHIMARYSFANKLSREPKKKLVEYVVERAVQSAVFLGRIESAFAPEDWSEDFEKDVEKLTRGDLSISDFQCIVLDHMAAQEERISAVRADLPESDTADRIMSDFEEVARSKLPRRLESKAAKDSRLQRTLEKLADRAIEVDARIARATKLRTSLLGDRGRKRPLEEHQHVGEGSAADGDEDGDNHAEDGASLSSPPPQEEVPGTAGSPGGESRPAKRSRQGERCPACKPEANIRYHCTHCGMTHLPACKLLVKLADSESERRTLDEMKDRLCAVCRGETTSSSNSSLDHDLSERGRVPDRPKKKRKENRALADYESLRIAALDYCRGKNAVLHEGLPLTPGDDLFDDDSVPIPVTAPPKLTVVAVDAEKALTRRTGDSNGNLRRCVLRLASALHSRGTIVFAVPRPWFLYGGHIWEALAQDPSITMEESPLILQYESSSSGDRPREEAHLVTNCAEALLLAHKAPQGGGERGCGFTVKRRVTMDDPDGIRKGPIPEFPQIISGLTHPSGAPNGGARCALPESLLQVLVGRYSSAGDTVLGVGVETTQLPEVTLDRGRRLELFLADKGASEAVRGRINESFNKAFDSRLFRMELPSTILVGPSNLPSGLPADITPEALKISAGTSQEDIETKMRQAAKAWKYRLQLVWPGIYDLFVETPSAGKRPPYHDIPLWGSLVVYDTPEDAENTLSREDRREHRVRLILVATNKQLIQMLAPGKEICFGRAALYLRLAKTCPLYYVPWEEHYEHAVLDIVSNVPRSGDRQRLLDAVAGTAVGGGAHGVTACVREERKTSTSRGVVESPLCVYPGENVVGTSCFQDAYFDEHIKRRRMLRQRRKLQRQKDRIERGGRDGSDSDDSGTDDGSDSESSGTDDDDDDGDGDGDGEGDGEGAGFPTGERAREGANATPASRVSSRKVEADEPGAGDQVTVKTDPEEKLLTSDPLLPLPNVTMEDDLPCHSCAVKTEPVNDQGGRVGGGSGSGSGGGGGGDGEG